MILPAARDTSRTTPRRRNSRTASRAQRNWPVRLIDSTLFHCARVMLRSGVRLHAGIGDEYVERAELTPHALEHCDDLSLVRDVCLVCVGSNPELSSLSDDGLTPQGVRYVVDDNVGARPRQRDGDCAAQAGAGPSHDGLLRG